MKNNRETGRHGEDIAADFLEKNGYTVIARNFCTKGGETDIIARDGEYLVFCEVKYRMNAKFGDPLEAVGAKKLSGMKKCAEKFIYHNFSELARLQPRFDVIGIVGKENGNEIRHIKAVDINI